MKFLWEMTGKIIWSGSTGRNIFISKCIAVECYNIYSWNVLLHGNRKNCID